jgi:septal ring factor EnvC (AmiA/AmiB activator)
LVLAGLGHVERTVGETVLPGERLGDLGGALPGLTEFSLEDGAPEGQTKDRMLYLELRRNGEAVDPAPWFAARQE